jgi:hypothetical protein
MRQNGNSRRRLSRLWSVLFFVAVLLLISLACNLPDSLPIVYPGQPASHVQTSVAKTLIAIEVSQLPVGTQTSGEINPLTITPTDSPAPSGNAKLFVSENTNCRIGQGTAFERLTILLKGEEADVVGVDTSGNYWYIRRPDQPTSFCWLWGGYATPIGPIESLPVYTPVPTATPGFEFGFTYHSTVGLCGGFYVLQYSINNTGSVTLESWRTTSTDHTGGSGPQPNQQNQFYDISGCTPAGDKVNLSPGEAYFVNAMFNSDPAGHDITVNVQVCSADSLGGECRSRTFRHTP